MTTVRTLMPLRLALLLAPLLASLAVAPRARAEGSAADAAAGSALFYEGKALLDAGKYAAAVERFKAASALAPTVGTYLNLGDAYEKAGQTASALGAFAQADVLARTVGDVPRQSESKRRMSLLEPRLSKVRFDVASASRGVGVILQIDGRAIPEGAWDSAIPVDPGDHSIEASRAGRQVWKATVTVKAEAGTTTVPVPALEDAVQSAPVPPTAGTAAAADGGSAAAGGPSFKWSGQRFAGVGVGGLGLAGLTIGGVLGGMAKTKYDATTPAECFSTPANVCNPAGIAARATVAKLGNASTGLLVAGGAAVVAGVIVVVTAPPEDRAKTGGLSRWGLRPQTPGSGLRRFEVSAAAGPGTAGLRLGGEW